MKRSGIAMQASNHQTHRERPGTSTITADYAVVPTSSPFSAIHLLRNYRLLDLVTNPRYELLYPAHHQSLTATATCRSYRDYGIGSEIYERDSVSLGPTTRTKISIVEDSASSTSPPVPPRTASSAATSFNDGLTVPAGNSLRQPTTSAISEPRSNSIRSIMHQPALINVPQQFSDNTSFPEPAINDPRQLFVGDARTVSGVTCRRPRCEKRPIPDEQKDDKYYERRKRNNQAAKKSRDARKIREDHIALRATMLEHENAILRTQILTLREEAQSLRRMLIEQQMPTMAARYAMECPRPSLASPATLPSTASRRTVVSAAAPLSRPSSKLPTPLFI